MVRLDYQWGPIVSGQAARNWIDSDGRSDALEGVIFNNYRQHSPRKVVRF